MDFSFDEYLRLGEPDKKRRAENWQIAIGLQAVDGLKPSQYLIETARRNIEGEISIEETKKLVSDYYIAKVNRTSNEESEEEADRVSANIACILKSPAFAFNTNGFISLHRRIFEGVFKHAGKIRDYDISKQEWVLDGKSVNYLNWEDLRSALDYDLAQEQNYSYRDKTFDLQIEHIAKFVSGIWQIHPFCEGNTRTTAVFTILYLRSLGFEVQNDMFAQHSWYFRNALVRANYKNVQLGIEYSPKYLQRFFRNLLIGEQWVLQNRYLNINAPEEYQHQPRLDAPELDNDTPTSIPTSTPTSTILRLIAVLKSDMLSVSEMMKKLELKDRKNFLEYTLNPAIQQGYVTMQYPNSPHHPRQKYLLTDKGKGLKICSS